MTGQYGDDHRRGVWAVERSVVLLPTAPSCHNRGVADPGGPVILGTAILTGSSSLFGWS